MQVSFSYNAHHIETIVKLIKPRLWAIIGDIACALLFIMLGIAVLIVISNVFGILLIMLGIVFPFLSFFFQRRQLFKYLSSYKDDAYIFSATKEGITIENSTYKLKRCWKSVNSIEKHEEMYKVQVGSTSFFMPKDAFITAEDAERFEQIMTELLIKEPAAAA